jgi:hypothetical protein
MFRIKHIEYGTADLTELHAAEFASVEGPEWEGKLFANGGQSL